MSQTTRKDERLDQTVADSFPASDPPANTPVNGSRKAERMPTPEPDDAMVPKGMPTSDRHHSETAAGRIEGAEPAEKHDPKAAG